MGSVFCFRRHFKGKVMEVQHRCGCPRPRSHLPAPRAGLPELPTAWAAAPRPGKRRSPAPSLLPLLSHQQRGPRHYPPRHLQPPPAPPGHGGARRARKVTSAKSPAGRKGPGPARPRHACCRPAAPALERKQSGQARPPRRRRSPRTRPAPAPASQSPSPPPPRSPKHRTHHLPSPSASAAE